MDRQEKKLRQVYRLHVLEDAPDASAAKIKVLSAATRGLE